MNNFYLFWRFLFLTSCIRLVLFLSKDMINSGTRVSPTRAYVYFLLLHLLAVSSILLHSRINTHHSPLGAHAVHQTTVPRMLNLFLKEVIRRVFLFPSKQMFTYCLISCAQMFNEYFISWANYCSLNILLFERTAFHRIFSISFEKTIERMSRFLFVQLFIECLVSWTV